MPRKASASIKIPQHYQWDPIHTNLTTLTLRSSLRLSPPLCVLYVKNPPCEAAPPSLIAKIRYLAKNSQQHDFRRIQHRCR